MGTVREQVQGWEELLSRWINVDSTSGREGEFLEVLEDHFSAHGYRCRRLEVEPGRWNLLCLPASQDEEVRLLFTTHIDCVPPHIPARVGEVGGERCVFGRGACDTKGGVVAMFYAAEALKKEGIGGVGFLFVVGEEVDHCGARHVAKLGSGGGLKELGGVRQLILCEPTQNRVLRAQKGMLRMVVRASGRAAHSAYPERGESAIDRLLEVLEEWRRMPLPRDPLLGETTVNIGLLEGGVAANVLAPAASCEILIRAVSDVAELLTRYEEVARGRVEIEVRAKNDPVFFEAPEGVATTVVAFNTDATYLQELGPIWLVGPGDIEVAHSDGEHITEVSFLEGGTLYTELGRRVLLGE